MKKVVIVLCALLVTLDGLSMTGCGGSGSPTTGHHEPDRTALWAAIAEAQEILDSTYVSEEYGEDIHEDRYWVSAGNWANFEGEISGARRVYGNNAATQAQIDDAHLDMRDATTEFLSARSPSELDVNEIAWGAP